MGYYLIVFLLQVVFNILKVFEIKFTYQNKLNSLLINSVLINLISLGSVYYSIDRLFNNDWWIIVAYLLGSVLGKYIGMKYKFFK
jgi:uncharacterized membrane protein YfcA